MAIRTVIQIGHPSLKAKNKIIKSFNSSKVKQLIKDLTDTMYNSGLIGIAATQIAENYLIFITHARNTKSRNLGKEDTLRIFINPKLTYISKEKLTLYEGCGSVAETQIFGPVERSKEITVEAFDENGDKFWITCDGILARVILHEYDHLQGIAFIQSVKDYKQMLSQEYYVKDIKNSKKQLSASVITKIEYKKF
jgi:peptide deformylase